MVGCFSVCYGSCSGKEIAHIVAQKFTYDELATATRNFNEVRLLGEGGFGRAYMGRLHRPQQVVAVKQLDGNGLQGNTDFLGEVLMLSRLHHPNLVDLIGYCADGDERLLVYEYMTNGSLKDRLHSVVNWGPLDWNTRMKIAAGVAKGLEYLHDEANPPVVYRDLKSSNILLGNNYHPKLSDFGLAVSPPVGDKTHVSSSVMATYGYCDPDYATTGQLTLQSNVYSFGVVLLELITGRKAIENTIALGEHNLVAWATPLFKDRSNFWKMVDRRLKGRYPKRGVEEALAVAAMCLQEQAATRPLIGDVVTVLTHLASETYNPRRDDRSEFEPEWRWTFDDLAVQDPQTGSPASAGGTPTNTDAVAEAKAWGENWRKEEEEGECKVNMQLRER